MSVSDGGTYRGPTVPDACMKMVAKHCLRECACLK